VVEKRHDMTTSRSFLSIWNWPDFCLGCKVVYTRASQLFCSAIPF